MPKRISGGIPGSIPKKVHGGILGEIPERISLKILPKRNIRNYWRHSLWNSLRDSLQNLQRNPYKDLPKGISGIMLGEIPGRNPGETPGRISKELVKVLLQSYLIRSKKSGCDPKFFVKELWRNRCMEYCNDNLGYVLSKLKDYRLEKSSDCKSGFSQKKSKESQKSIHILIDLLELLYIKPKNLFFLFSQQLFSL